MPRPSKIWKAQELEKMTPAERKAIFDDALVSDLADAPPHLVEQARQVVLKRIEESERSKR